MVGVTISTFAIGGTLILMNNGLQDFPSVQIPLKIRAPRVGVNVENKPYTIEGKTYTMVAALGSSEIPDGNYLYDPAEKRITRQWIQGIGSEKAPAPQAKLMATVINGILTQRLPWRLVLMGVALVLAVELLWVRSLAFAVGSYLSIATTMAIFDGGAVPCLGARPHPILPVAAGGRARPHI